MVYCTKCGTLNPDDYTRCSNSGTLLHGTVYEDRSDRRQENREYHEQKYGGRRRGGCIGLFIIGLIVVLVAVAVFFGSFSLFWEFFWPIVLVVLGVWLLLRGINANRRYRQPQTR